MKKFVTLLAAFGLLMGAAYAQTFVIKLGGGMGSVSGGDLSAGIRGQNDYLAQQFQATSAFGIPKTGVDLAGELVIYPWPHFGFGIGASYFQTAKQSSVSYSYGDLHVQETINPLIRAVPITLNLHWNVVLTDWLHLDVAGGVGLYSATLKWDYQNTYTVGDINGSEHYTFSASKNSTLGYQGGLGLEYIVSSRVAVVLDFYGRAASITPFSNGAWTDQWSGTDVPPDASGNDHSFWYYDWDSGSQTFAQIAFQADQPTGDPSIKNARLGSIDLNGYTATIGIRLRFGH
jgi:hypothetical protein